MEKAKLEKLVNESARMAFQALKSAGVDSMYGGGAGVGPLAAAILTAAITDNSVKEALLR